LVKVNALGDILALFIFVTCIPAEAEQWWCF